MVTDVVDVTTLINSYATVTIPAVIALALGILNAVNHFRNSSKITHIAERVGEVGGKIDTTIQANIGKIDSGVQTAANLSPQLAGAIDANKSQITTLQAQQALLQAKIDELNAYVRSLSQDSSTTTPVSNA